jgi:enamine deaminase RidA (YjgF/YER057c/UK114 family)
VALSPGNLLVGAIIGDGAVRNKGKTSPGRRDDESTPKAGAPRFTHSRASCYRCRSSSGIAQKGTAMAAEINIYNPEELGPPMGQYTHVTRVRANEFLFIAGMLSGDAAGNVIGEGQFDVQTAQVFRNIESALKSAGASWANVVQFTTYLVHSQDIPKFMEFRLREFPKMFPDRKYPPNTLLMVDRLVKEAFLVEVQTIAAV